MPVWNLVSFHLLVPLPLIPSFVFLSFVSLSCLGCSILQIQLGSLAERCELPSGSLKTVSGAF